MANDLVFKPLPGDWHNGNDLKVVEVLKISGPPGVNALLYTCNVNIDYDGASTAYGPAGKEPLDSLTDGGYPGWWFGLIAFHPQARVADMNDDAKSAFKIGTKGALATEFFGVTLDARYPDSKGRCPVKGDNGYFVSSTPHANGKFRDKYKQSSYTDAATVAFGALSGELEKTGKVAVGDCGLAIRHNAALSTSFYFADRGATAGTAKTAVGECSYARFRAVGGDAKVPGKTPKNNWAVNFLVFPGSRTGDSDKAMDNTARQQFQLINGASNAGDLALLMAFAGVAHNGSSGIRALNAYQGKKETAKPVGYDNVVKELGAFGFDPGK